jgi:phage-related protein
MSNPTYNESSPAERPLVWLHGEVKSPPFSLKARLEAGFLLRRLQMGETLSMPHSRPMPVIGRGCHELGIADAAGNWRIVYRADPDAVVIAEVFLKKTRKTPPSVIESSRDRLRRYDDA